MKRTPGLTSFPQLLLFYIVIVLYSAAKSFSLVPGLSSSIPPFLVAINIHDRHSIHLCHSFILMYPEMRAATKLADLQNFDKLGEC